ncbi:MAG: carboxylesterase family protein [Candidatus Eiseniibacteriota bacterium]
MSAPLGLARRTVRLVAYDERWPELFESERRLLQAHLGDHIVEMAHIGSTAIPGLDAKPVLDLMVAVPSLRIPAPVYSTLEGLGYEHRPHDDVPDRLFFAKGGAEQRTHHLSLCERDSHFWRAHLSFREHLRRHPSVAHDYLELKRGLAARFASDRPAYTTGKESFVKRVLGSLGVFVLGLIAPAILSLALLVFGTARAQGPGPRVEIESGMLEGAAADSVVSFKGIPYAAQPVGGLRWRPPQPIQPWAGVRQAGAFGHDCVQFPIPGDAGASGAERGEDCLMLNVWRPAAIPEGEKLPVMVWIHGGGFLNGAASVPFFDGSRFAREGIVFVSFNYRLGRLGFFAHPALSARSERPLANYAFMDQLAALQWVQRNVHAFGGDPRQVTIVGESAGGISVVHLLMWDKAQGLFQRAAVLSGSGRRYMPQFRKLKEATGPLPSAEAAGVAFAESVGVLATGEAGLEALRKLPAERVNGDMSMLALLQMSPTYVGGPVNDGEIVTAKPEENIRKNEFAKVPLLIGTTGADLPADFPPDRTRPLDFFGPDSARASKLYDPDGTMPPDQLSVLIAADMTMHEPARFLAERMAATGEPTWIYRFDYVPEFLRGKMTHAPHAGELGFLFDQLGARYGKGATARDREMAKTFHGYFVRFVKHGDPSGRGLPAWPKVDPSRDDLMMFGADGKARLDQDPWGERLRLVTRAQERRGAPATR